MILATLPNWAAKPRSFGFGCVVGCKCSRSSLVIDRERISAPCGYDNAAGWIPGLGKKERGAWARLTGNEMQCIFG